MDNGNKKFGPQIPAEIICGMTIFVSEEKLWKLSTRSCPGEKSSEKGLQDTGKASDKAAKDSKTLGFTGKTEVATKSPEKWNKYSDTVDDTKQAEVAKVAFDPEYVRNVYGKDLAHICAFFNIMLAQSSLAKEYLPLEKSNMLDILSDGILLCAMANVLQPGTVDEAAVFPGRVLKYPCGWIHKWKNMNLGLMSLQILGLYIDASYVIHYPYRNKSLTPLPPAILLQVMRLSALRKMNLKDNEQLVYIFDSWQDEQEIAFMKTLSSEEMLKRWVNYQLRRAGTDFELKDFTGLADSLIYGHLLDTVAPEDKKSSLTSVQHLKAEKDLMLRAAMVVKNAEILGIKCGIAPEHIAGAISVTKPSASVSNQVIYVMNLVFLAQIYSSYPNIDVPKQSLNPNFSESLRSSYVRGSTEEMLVMWLNSFGVSSPVVYLDTDLRNGLTLLQVWEAMLPGCVNWSKVNLNVANSRMPRYKDCCLTNCWEVMRCAQNFDIKFIFSPEDIVTGEIKGTMMLLLKMMNLDVVLQHCNRGYDAVDAHLCDNTWKKVESQLANWMKFWRCNLPIVHLNDPQLKSTNFLAYFAERQLLRGHCAGHRIRCDANALPGTDGANAADRNPSDDDDKTTIKRSIPLQFQTIQPVPSSEWEQHSRSVINMLRQSGVTVFTSRLGPDTDGLIYRSAILQIRSL